MQIRKKFNQVNKRDVWLASCKITAFPDRARTPLFPLFGLYSAWILPCLVGFQCLEETAMGKLSQIERPRGGDRRSDDFKVSKTNVDSPPSGAERVALHEARTRHADITDEEFPGIRGCYTTPCTLHNVML